MKTWREWRIWKHEPVMLQEKNVYNKWRKESMSHKQQFPVDWRSESSVYGQSAVLIWGVNVQTTLHIFPLNMVKYYCFSLPLNRILAASDPRSCDAFFTLNTVCRPVETLQLPTSPPPGPYYTIAKLPAHCNQLWITHPWMTEYSIILMLIEITGLHRLTVSSYSRTC